MAEDAVDAVKARPVAVGGAAAALGLFLARRPISDAAVKLYDALTSRDRSTPEDASEVNDHAPSRGAGQENGDHR
jgi:hypothetical protein